MSIKELKLEFKSLDIILRNEKLLNSNQSIELDYDNKKGYVIILKDKYDKTNVHFFNMFKRLKCKEMTMYIKGIRHGFSILKGNCI